MMDFNLSGCSYIQVYTVPLNDKTNYKPSEMCGNDIRMKTSTDRLRNDEQMETAVFRLVDRAHVWTCMCLRPNI